MATLMDTEALAERIMDLIESECEGRGVINAAVVQRAIRRALEEQSGRGSASTLHAKSPLLQARPVRNLEVSRED